MVKVNEDGRTALAVKGTQEKLASSDVIQYLQQHPDFFSRHPEILESLNLPVRNQGDKVVDLQQFMVSRLRRDVTKLRAEKEEFIANTRDNVQTQDRIQQAILKILQADTAAALIKIIIGELPVLLDVDHAVLCLEGSAKNYHALQGLPIRFLKNGSIEKLMNGTDQPVLLRDDINGDTLLYPTTTAVALVRSDALLRLKFTKTIGLLVFATRHPGYFDAEQGTDFLKFMGRVIEITLQRYIN